jgi:hypothetical protein
MGYIYIKQMEQTLIDLFVEKLFDTGRLLMQWNDICAYL